MDTTPLTQRAVYSADTTVKPPFTQPSEGSERTQTVQAVQATDKAAAGFTSANTDTKDESLSSEQLAEMAEQMDSFVGSFTHELKFRVDEDSGRNVVTVIDTKSGDIIRQIPTEELLEVVARLAEASGGLINVKA